MRMGVAGALVAVLLGLAACQSSPTLETDSKTRRALPTAEELPAPADGTAWTKVQSQVRWGNLLSGADLGLTCQNWPDYDQQFCQGLERITAVGYQTSSGEHAAFAIYVYMDESSARAAWRLNRQKLLHQDWQLDWDELNNTVRYDIPKTGDASITVEINEGDTFRYETVLRKGTVVARVYLRTRHRHHDIVGRLNSAQLAAINRAR
jgi:hypothetical protein